MTGSKGGYEMTKRVTDEEVKRLLGKFTPDQLAIAKTLATLRIENKMLKAQNEALSKEHANLWRILIVLLHYYRENGIEELRIHQSQFMRFDDLYRIDQTYDEQTEEIVLRLLTIGEEGPSGGGEESVH